MRTAKLDDRPGAWGFPRVTGFRIPEVGDAIKIGEGGYSRVVHVLEGVVTFAPAVEAGELTVGWHGSLRMSATGDGLFLHKDGSERDGYSLRLESEDPCMGCRKPLAVWRLRAGRGGDS